MIFNSLFIVPYCRYYVLCVLDLSSSKKNVIHLFTNEKDEFIVTLKIGGFSKHFVASALYMGTENINLRWNVSLPREYTINLLLTY
jgi:hypothetical protein